MSELKIGLIGLDTSHAPAFTGLLNDSSAEHHVAGGRVVAAFPGGSPDFDLSINRVEGYTNELRDKFGVQIVDSPVALAEAVDAVMITSVDGRAHLDLFRQIAHLKRPTFIDKPFATTSSDARAMAELAKENGISLFTSSSLRYAVPFVEALEKAGKENVFAFDVSGPMDIQPTQPGFFWYGIHTVEILYATLGRGCVRVTTVSTEDHDVAVGEWADGRIGTVRGNRAGGHGFSALLHTGNGDYFVDAYGHPKPPYAGLLERAIPMFQGGQPPVDIEDSVEIIRFIEAANESRGTGLAVTL